MGRQPYLTRLALGRSAFEPPTPGTFPTQNQPIQRDLIDNPNDIPQEYVQLYDEAGRPVNPRSQTYGRSLRAAQNDVFAAFGVVQRKEQEAAGLEEEEGDSEAEDLTADTISAFTHSPAHLFTWWITVLKARIMGCEMNSHVPLAAIARDEYMQCGSTMLHRGLPLTLTFNLIGSYFSYELSYSRLLAQFLLWAKVSRSKRRTLLKTTLWGSRIFSFLVELAFLPLGYYSTLQTIGLAPAKYLPPLSAFTPGSVYCPWPKLLWPTDLSSESFRYFLVSLVISPAMVLLVASRLNALLYNSVRTYLPNYVDIHTRLLQPRKLGDDDRESTEIAQLILEDDRPLLTRTLTFLGWGHPIPNVHIQGTSPTVERAANLTGLTVAMNHVSETTGPHVEVPVVSTDFLLGLVPPRPPRNPIATFHDILADEASTELPPSPGQRAQVNAWTSTASVTSENPDESSGGGGEVGYNTRPDVNGAITNSQTRVRITTREPGTLTVELEIDSVEVGASTDRSLEAPETLISPGLESDMKPHRVSRLTKGPSKFLADMLALELVTLVDLPFKSLAFRFCALYFTGVTIKSSAGGALSLYSVNFWQAQLANISVKSIAIFTQRILFCSVASLVVDLGVWGLNYGLTRCAGIRYYRWGKL